MRVKSWSIRSIWLTMPQLGKYLHNFPGLYYRSTLVLEVDSMEEMWEEPDARSLADVHALISALLFLTCFFFNSFFLCWCFCLNLLQMPSFKSQAGKLKYLTGQVLTCPVWWPLVCSFGKATTHLTERDSCEGLSPNQSSALPPKTKTLLCSCHTWTRNR